MPVFPSENTAVEADAPATWEWFREQMPAARQWAYLDHAAVAPLSGPAQTALDQWTADLAAHGATNWSHWKQRIAQIRRLAATWIGATDDELALVRNTTEGIGLVAEGIDWRSGDNMVTLADEFPSNLFPWQNLRRLGVECRTIPTDRGEIDWNSLRAACDRRTRLVSFSWVNFAHGYRYDLDALAEIVHAGGAWLFVDAIQGLGVFPLDVRQTPIDFLAADGHKWMLGPEGAGILYVRNGLLDRLQPLGIGWNSVVHAGDYTNTNLTLKPSAARYEGGSYNVAGIIALGASLDLLARFGTERLSARVLELTDLACERLQSIGAQIISRRDGDHRSGIVSFDLGGRSLRLARKRAIDQHVALSLRAERLRISPHAYCDPTDIDRLIEALSAPDRD